MKIHVPVVTAVSIGSLATACSNAAPGARQSSSEEPVASIHQADVGNSAWGYASVSAAGTVDPHYSSPGTTVTRDLLGFYTVTFPNLNDGEGAAIDQGSLQVSARGWDNTRCVLGSSGDGFFNDPNDLFFEVFCAAPDGTPRDAPFVVTFVRRTDVRNVEGGYVQTYPWFDAEFPQETFAATGSGLPGGSHWNSTGEDIVVQHYDPGVYMATFRGQDYLGGTAEVTGFDSGEQGAYCELAGWWPDGADQDVWVYCFDRHGNFADAAFDLRATTGNPTIAGAYTYAWADDPTPTSSYVPDTTYQAGFDGCNRTAPMTIEPFGSQPGSYLAHFPSMDTFAGWGAVPMVSAYGGSGEYCKIGTWGASAGSAYTTVYCFDYTGQPAPAYFTIAYTVDEIRVC
jgi:hypothetical protein